MNDSVITNLRADPVDPVGREEKAHGRVMLIPKVTTRIPAGVYVREMKIMLKRKES